MARSMERKKITAMLAAAILLCGCLLLAGGPVAGAAEDVVERELDFENFEDTTPGKLAPLEGDPGKLTQIAWTN